MKKLRTINQILELIKKDDPDSCITEYMIKKLIKDEKYKIVRIGNKNLYDTDVILERMGLI